MGINQQFNEQNPPIFHLNVINTKTKENNQEHQKNIINDDNMQINQTINFNPNHNLQDSLLLQGDSKISSIKSVPNINFFSNQNEDQLNLNNNNENKLSIYIQIIDDNTVNVKIPLENNQTWIKVYNKDELIETVIKDYSQENNINIPLNNFNEIIFDNRKVNLDDKIRILLLPNSNPDINISNPYNIDIIENIDNKTKYIELTPLDEKFIEVLGKPFYDPFEISCFYKNEKKFKILKYPYDLIEKTQLINFSISSTYCNGYNNLFLSGGENSPNNFWEINLKENIINEPIYIPPKKNHSMLYIPKSTVFIVGGDTLDTFYYDIKNKKILEWGKLNYIKISPALIQIRNKLFCIDSINQRNYKVYYSFEYTELTKKENDRKWIVVKPKLSFNIINRIFNQQLFGVVRDKDDNIVFMGGSMTDNNKRLNFMYNIKSNTIGLSLVKYKKFNVKEKSFCPFNITYDCLLTDFKRNSPQIAFYNKRKGKIDLIDFSPGNDDNDNGNYADINNNVINSFSNQFNNNIINNNNGINYYNIKDNYNYNLNNGNKNKNNYANNRNNYINNYSYNLNYGNQNKNNYINNRNNNFNNNNYSQSGIINKDYLQKIKNNSPSLSFFNNNKNTNIYNSQKKNNLNNKYNYMENLRGHSPNLSFWKNKNLGRINFSPIKNINRSYDGNIRGNSPNLSFWKNKYKKKYDMNLNPNQNNNMNYIGNSGSNSINNSPNLSFWKYNHNLNNISSSKNRNNLKGNSPNLSFWKNNKNNLSDIKINPNNTNNNIHGNYKLNSRGNSPNLSFWKNNKNLSDININPNNPNNNIHGNYKTNFRGNSPNISFWKNNNNSNNYSTNPNLNQNNFKSQDVKLNNSPNLSFWNNKNINLTNSNNNNIYDNYKPNPIGNSPNLSFWKNEENKLDNNNINQTDNNIIYSSGKENIRNNSPNLSFWKNNNFEIINTDINPNQNQNILKSQNPNLNDNSPYLSFWNNKNNNLDNIITNSINVQNNNNINYNYNGNMRNNSPNLSFWDKKIILGDNNNSDNINYGNNKEDLNNLSNNLSFWEDNNNINNINNGNVFQSNYNNQNQNNKIIISNISNYENNNNINNNHRIINGNKYEYENNENLKNNLSFWEDDNNLNQVNGLPNKINFQSVNNNLRNDISYWSKDINLNNNNINNTYNHKSEIINKQYLRNMKNNFPNLS